MLDFILKQIGKIFEYTESSQRVVGHAQDVVDLTKISYEEGVRRIHQIMSGMNAEDRDSFANLIKFLAKDMSGKGYYAQASKLVALHPLAAELAGR